MSDSENTWFNNWPDGLLGLNRHNRIVEISPVAQSILGYSRDDIYGTDPHQQLCADTRNDHHPEAGCLLLSHDQDSDIRSALWRHKNGHYLSVDLRIIPVGFGEASRVISFIDNSTRQHNQAEMEKFSEYVEKSPAPLAEFVMDGQLLFGNTALQELIIEYGFDDNGAAIALPKNIEQIAAKLTQEDLTDQTVEVQLEHSVFVWHFHLLENNHIPTVVGYAFDVTAQKEAERIATEQRSQARKEFYAKMVHELRSPLNAIVGFSDLLSEDLRGVISDEQLRWLSLIRDAGMKLNDQVTATLDITKIESGKMTIDISEFAVTTLCQEVFDQLQPLAQKKGLAFALNTFTDQRIFSDQAKVRQILINLVSNAIKYSEEGNVDIIVCQKDDSDLGNCISLIVADTGIGIKSENIPRLFRSFEQVDEEKTRNVQGTGLGLALVNNLVKLLGGQINVDSEYGAGSTFEVLLPFLNSRPEAS